MGGCPKKKTSHSKSWTEVPNTEYKDDEVDVMVKEIKKAWKKPCKDHTIIQDLMQKTYSRRRTAILVDIQRINYMITEFPPLQNMLYMSKIMFLGYFSHISVSILTTLVFSERHHTKYSNLLYG
jgi:hypothetical protein